MRGGLPDVVIVGGGVMGLSIAVHLVETGARPLVLERSHLGAGSTGKSGAILRQHYSLELTAAMARDSLEEYREFEARMGGGAGFVATGVALIVGSEDRGGLETNLEMQRSLGIRTEQLDGLALREALRGAVADEFSVACFEPDAGYADPIATLATLRAALERGGGEVREGACVRELIVDGSRVRGVVTPEGELEAPIVVVAAGPWAESLMATAGWDARIQPMRVQSAVFRRPSDFDGGPVVIDFVNEMYAKHTASDTHVGSLDPAETQRVDPDRYDEGVEAGYVGLARERLVRRFPAMRRAVSYGGYGALYSVTPDWHPVIGPAGPDGLYLCGGFSGHGFKLAPAVGRTVAAEILDRDPPYDFEPLRPGRFLEGRAVRGRYAYSIIG